MKRVLLIIMLAMSISYSKPTDDVEYISSLLTDCANRDLLKYITLLTNMARTGRSDSSLSLYSDYIINYCPNELAPINSVLNRYNTRGRAAILAGAIGMQYSEVAGYFKSESEDYLKIIENILGN